MFITHASTSSLLNENKHATSTRLSLGIGPSVATRSSVIHLDGRPGLLELVQSCDSRFFLA